MIKKDTKNLEEYYFQWMSAYKNSLDDAVKLLKEYNKKKKVCMFCDTRYHTDDCLLAKFIKEMQ